MKLYQMSDKNWVHNMYNSEQTGSGYNALQR